MKVTEQGRIRPVMSAAAYLAGDIGPSGQVPTSNGSNAVSWGSNIATIWSNGSNQLLGPHVNFASGSNVHFAAASNTLTIHAVGTGGGAAISGITVKDEGVSLGAEATTLDFVGAGVSASGSGSTKTITISGSGSGFEGHEDFWTPPDSAGTYDEEFAGTADTLPTNWSWTTEPTGSNSWKLNSRWKRCLIIERAATDTTTFELRRTSLTPGAIDIGFWWYMDIGIGQWNNNTTTAEVLFRDSSGNAGFGMRLVKTSVLAVTSRDRTGGVTSDVSAENAANNDTRMGLFCGVTRKTSDNTWRAMISGDGRAWTHLGATTTRSVTIDHMQVTFTAGNNAGTSRFIFGPLRSRADLLEWAPR